MTNEERLRADTLDELLGKEMLDNIALRAEVERLKTKCVDIVFHEQATDALRAENERLIAMNLKQSERLREALKDIVKWGMDDQMVLIARAALQSKGEKE